MLLNFVEIKFCFEMNISSENQWQKKAMAQKKKYQSFLKRVNIQKTIKILSALHEKAFANINCLDCAACCKNYSPRFKGPDIRRISGKLRIKETEFVDKYLYADQEGDFVLKTKPCPFLGSDNTCSIYDYRPSDCSRFPYTDEDVLLKKPAITLKNVEFCPAVYFVLEELLG